MIHSQAVVEPPSAELVRTLRDLKLCGPGELRQAARLVRDLANDLPTFDSVWIDALVQLRCLTHFQGECLSQSAGPQLQCGSLVLSDHQGRDGWYNHFSARSTDTGDARWLTCIDIRGLNAASITERLESTLATLRRIDQKFLHRPPQIELDGQRLLLISEPAEGRDLRELVTRRGRWTPKLVLDVAAQLASGLAALERAGLCHGDVRLETVRLSDRGTARLFLAGILVAIQPELTIHAQLTPDCTECLAPERIGLGSEATSKSDQYSLGCLLWHLLTGRPPYLSADPLTKVAQHQTRTLPDVRELAPDTPDHLWHVIARLTARMPEDRFSNWNEVLGQLGHATHAGQRRLAKLAATFDRPAITARDWSELWQATRRIARVAAAVALLAAALIWLPANRGLLLSLTGMNRDSANAGPSSDDALDDSNGNRNGTQQRLSPPYQLIAPDREGVVLLSGRGPWRASELEVAGTLTIRGAPGEVPVVAIEGDAWRLTADSLRIENIIVQRADTMTPEGDVGNALIVVQANEVQIDRCALIDRSSPQALVHMHGPEGLPAISRLLCSDSFLVSQGAAFNAEAGIRDVRLEQVLRIGTGPLVEAQRLLTTDQRLSLSQVTMRQAGPLWRLPAGAGQLQLQVSESILELEAGNACLEFIGIGTPQDWPAVIEITGDGTLATPSILVGTRFSDEMPVAKVDESTIQIDGVFGGEFSFRQPASLRPIDSTLANWESDTPRQNPADPGIDATRLIDPEDRLIRTGELE